MTEATPTDSRWFYLCADTALDGPNRFVTTQIGPIPLVAQTIKGRTVAFRNVCTHRFAVIHDAASGCGPLRCPYHGWSFDADGVPTGVPFNPTDFQLDAEGRRRLVLNPASLARCGRLIFIRVATDGPTLAEQIGQPLFDRLAALSTAFSRSALSPITPGAAGWEWLETGNLRVALKPGAALVLEGAPPPGADARFARHACFLPTHADVESPA